MVSLYRHFERSREIFIAARESVRMRHSINDALMLRFSAISHLLFIGVQERSLGYARDDDMRKALSNIYGKAYPPVLIRGQRLNASF